MEVQISEAIAHSDLREQICTGVLAWALLFQSWIISSLLCLDLGPVRGLSNIMEKLWVWPGFSSRLMQRQR